MRTTKKERCCPTNLKCRAHQGAGRALRWESSTWTFSNSVATDLRPRLQQLVLGCCRNGQDLVSSMRSCTGWWSTCSSSKHPYPTPHPGHLLHLRWAGSEGTVKWQSHTISGTRLSHLCHGLQCCCFFIPSWSLQKANLARAERQSKTRNLSSVPGSVTDFLCNCWICLCLSFHLHNWSSCQFCLFRVTRWCTVRPQSK